MKIAPGIELLKHPCGTAWSGIYLIVREKVIVIDTAFEPAMEALLFPALKEYGKTPEDITLVIHTHIHGDHIGGNRILKERTHAKFAVSELGAPKMRDPYDYLNRIRKAFSPPLPYQEIKTGLFPQEPDIILHEGDKIEGMEILHTPGHDFECISIFDPQSGILFTGDSLQGDGTRSAGLAFYRDRDAYCRSIEKIRRLAPKKLALGHPFHPTDGIVDDVNGFLTLCADTVARYDRELEKLPGNDLFSLTPEMIRRCGITDAPTVPVLAYHTVNTHLEARKK